MKRAIAVAGALTAALTALPSPALAAAPGLHTVPLPFLWPTARLQDVAADGAGGVWVGGVQGKYCLRWGDLCPVYYDGNPVVRHRVGSSWKEYPINGWTGQGEISRIASGAGETWIDGSNGYIGRFDGSAFQKVAGPLDSSHVIAAGPAGTFADGWDRAALESRFYKRTGDAWTAVDVPGVDAVLDVQSLTASDAWAVGYRNGEGAEQAPAVAHFDGTAWKSVPLPPISREDNDWFRKVVPVAADDVWGITARRLAHWDGSAWSWITPPEELAELGALTVDASGTPWVAAAPSGSARPPYRYSGGRWEKVAIPSGTRVYDLAAVPSGVWGVGAQGEDDPAAFTE